MIGMRAAFRRQRLPPEAASAGRARRLVNEVVGEAGIEELADVGSLLVSETVTNAVLHAATEVELTVVAGDGSLRVEVRDGSSVLPGVRHYEDEATTGRGIGLVELLSTSWGVEPEPGGGKTVWFVLGAEGAGVARPGADEEVAGDGAQPLDVPAPGFTVRLLGLPVHLTRAALQHEDAVLRELALAALSGQTPAGMPAWEGATIDLTPVLDPVEVALSEGEHSIDVEATFPAGADVGSGRRRQLVEQAEGLVASGGFLAHRPLPEVVRVRGWLHGEIIGQAGGAAPTPWVDSEELGPTGSWVRLSDRERDQLLELEGPVVVADETNHIIHVDEAAAALLGWGVDELVGRRLITIVPPALRGAHVAGYTRYQLTRSPVIVGSTVQVPALRKDGSTVEVSLLIQPYTSADGRPGFRATLEAV